MLRGIRWKWTPQQGLGQSFVSELLGFGNLFGCSIAGCMGCNGFLLLQGDTWSISECFALPASRGGRCPQGSRHRQNQTLVLAVDRSPSRCAWCVLSHFMGPLLVSLVAVLRGSLGLEITTMASLVCPCREESFAATLRFTEVYLITEGYLTWGSHFCQNQVFLPVCSRSKLSARSDDGYLAVTFCPIWRRFSEQWRSRSSFGTPGLLKAVFPQVPGPGSRPLPAVWATASASQC